jgi:basic membrane protein A
MAGAIAGLLAAHYGYPHAGVVLGMEFPDLWNFEIGYKWGVDWALSWYENKFGKIPLMGSIPRKERVLWTYIGSFTDITKGYLAAKPMYERGAVAVYNVAGGAGLGIKDALAELATIKGLEMGPPFWIGVDANQDWILPGFTIASTMGRFDRAVYYSTKLVLENKFRDVIKESGGKVTFKLMTEVGGLKIAGLSLSTLDDLDEFIEMGMKAENYVGRKVLPMSPEEIRNRVKKMREAQPSWLWEGVTELQDKIIKGEIVVPITETKEAIDYWRGLLG